MRFQPKRFVVEVKRGTNRAAFASPDAVSSKFSSAEAILFGGSIEAEGKTSKPSRVRSDVSGGRILRSLVEPPAPVVEDPDPPVRRGRKPGSKNKPKAVATVVAASDAEVERPRRGRKPGSKNRPKVPASSPSPDVSADQSAIADAMVSYGFADEGSVWPKQDASTIPDTREASPVAAARGGTDDGADRPGAGQSRTRFRDRSSILKRYVLDVEPRPGQPGALRARRLARATR